MAAQSPSMVRSAGLAQERLELGERLLDRVQVWTVGRQVEQRHAGRLDQVARTRGPLWLDRLSITTTSPGVSAGTSTRST